MKVLYKIIIAVLLVGYSHVALASNEATITLSNGSGVKGSSVSLNLTINTSQVLTNVAGVQWEFTYNPNDISGVSVTDGAAATSAGKNANCSVISSSVYRCLVVGFNSNTISNGVLSVATFTLTNSTVATQIPIQFSGLVATDSNANSVGILGTGGSITVTTPSDTTAPTIPSGLSATPISTSQINLSWTASTDTVGVVGYKIFRGGIQIGTSITNSYSDTGLSSATLYTYTVSAYDAAGNISSQSSSTSATTQSNSVGTSTSGSGGAYVPPITTSPTIIAATTSSNTITNTILPKQTAIIGTNNSFITSSFPKLTKILYLGMRGEEVAILQQFLVQKGYLQTTSPGYFGVKTQASVRKYQCDHNIVCTGSESTTGYGKVGVRTRTAINLELSPTGTLSVSDQMETEEQKIVRLTNLISTLLKQVNILQEQLKIMK